MDEDEIRRSAALEERHWWYAARRAMVRRELRGLEPGRALDVGCGMGGNTAVLRDLGWSAVGLDYSPASVEAARARGLTLVRGDARRLPFPDATFDLVLSTDAWEHVDDHEAVAAEAHRVLSPGGTLFVAVPAGMDPLQALPQLREWLTGPEVAGADLRRMAKACWYVIDTHLVKWIDDTTV